MSYEHFMPKYIEVAQKKCKHTEITSGFYKHNKSGKSYWVDLSDVVGYDNEINDQKYVVYHGYPRGKYFVCEKEVFLKDFHKEEYSGKGFLKKFHKEEYSGEA